MDTHAVSDKIVFLGKFLLLVGIIAYTSQIIQRELIEYYTLEDTQSPDSILVRPLRRTPWYQVLPKDSVIYSTKDEVAKKRDELIQQKKDFLFIDLDVMTLDQYRKGEIAVSYDVKAKGEEGSFSETPNGFYQLQWKEQNHFSKIHKVWMPWSLHFFGNYFIHGWPYLPNGTPVRSTTSGGCIRLLTENAAALYQSVKVGTPVLVSTSKEASSPEFAYFKRLPTKHETPRPFEIPSESALIADLDTGEILAEKNKDAVVSIGSLTKLMTALVASEAVSDGKIVTVSSRMVKKYPDEILYKAGETFFTENLLDPLLLSSSNIPSTLLGDSTWGFVDSMNQKARSIGLTRTHYKNAAGEDATNVSTAEDIFRLLRFIHAHKRPLFELTQAKSFMLRPRSGAAVENVININWPNADTRYFGGVSGNLPEENESLAAVFQIPFSEYGSRHIAIVLLGSHDKIKDAATVISYLDSQYVYGSILTNRWKILPPGRNGNSIYGVSSGVNAP